MIITRTPVRISFMGGGSDLPGYLKYGEIGETVSFAVSAYVTISVSQHFHRDRVRLSYSAVEDVSDKEYLRHNLVRSTLQKFNIGTGIEIHSIADIPGTGTGMGSSSALIVGLVRALNPEMKPYRVMLHAYQIERKSLGRSVGWQDFVPASFGGGVRGIYDWNRPPAVSRLCMTAGRLIRMRDEFVLFYTGITRDSNSIIGRQEATMDDPSRRIAIQSMVGMVQETSVALEDGEFERVGQLLNTAWEIKRELAPGITSGTIENMRSAALKAGATGVKLLGAGGGGFLLCHIPSGKLIDVAHALDRKPIQVDYGVKPEIIYNSANRLFIGGY